MGIFEHTADVGIEISRAQDLNELFSGAARGMVQVMAPNAEFSATDENKIQVGSDNYEELLVNFLSELNFLFQTEFFVPVAFSDISIQNTSITATVRGDVIETSRHTIDVEIKAVTYHELILEQRHDGWFARVLFDI